MSFHQHNKSLVNIKLQNRRYTSDTPNRNRESKNSIRERLNNVVSNLLPVYSEYLQRYIVIAVREENINTEKIKDIENNNITDSSKDKIKSKMF